MSRAQSEELYFVLEDEVIKGMVKIFYDKHGFIFTSDKKIEARTSEYVLKYQKEISHFQ